MVTIQLNTVSKSFNSKEVVKGVSFELESGEVFGLLGPNGAGKTTLIRMIMDIIKPDSGNIKIFNQPISSQIKNNIGYLPEERGLYNKQKVEEVLIYLAMLKDLSKQKARDNVTEYLKKIEMEEIRTKKLEELSKGMQQKIQIIAAFLTDPDIIILDEPFSGLDPINTRLIKDMILDLKQKDKTVLLSTHQMAQVEALCDKVLMINHGITVLHGELTEIKEQYSDNAVLIGSNADYDSMDMIDRYEHLGTKTKLYLKEAYTPNSFLTYLINQNVQVKSFELASTPIEDIFIRKAKEIK